MEDRMMMNTKMQVHTVDAFVGPGLLGNPAGVCALDRWPPDAAMQEIARRMALSETAFFVPEEGDRALRWFTPTTEVDLCGHATLASAAIYFQHIAPDAASVRFRTRHAGMLTVTRRTDLLELDFPARAAVPAAMPGIAGALGAAPLETLLFGELAGLAVFADAETVRRLRPDMALLAGLVPWMIIATAPGADCDFVSRVFAPREGIPEDPVTGAAHTTLVPYWSRRLDKTTLHAMQVSERGGELFCADRGDRTTMAGRAAIRAGNPAVFGEAELAPGRGQGPVEQNRTDSVRSDEVAHSSKLLKA